MIHFGIKKKQWNVENKIYATTMHRQNIPWICTNEQIELIKLAKYHIYNERKKNRIQIVVVHENHLHDILQGYKIRAFSIKLYYEIKCDWILYGIEMLLAVHIFLLYFPIHNGTVRLLIYSIGYNALHNVMQYCSLQCTGDIVLYIYILVC